MQKLFYNKKFNILFTDALLLILALIAPKIASLMMEKIPSCSFARMGILCPACGGTRCVESFFSGRISEAFEHNAFFTLLIFYAVILLVVANIYCLFDIKGLRMVIKWMSGYKTIISLAIAFAVFGFVRAYLLF